MDEEICEEMKRVAILEKALEGRSESLDGLVVMVGIGRALRSILGPYSSPEHSDKHHRRSGLP